MHSISHEYVLSKTDFNSIIQSSSLSLKQPSLVRLGTEISYAFLTSSLQSTGQCHVMAMNDMMQSQHLAYLCIIKMPLFDFFLLCKKFAVCYETVGLIVTTKPHQIIVIRHLITYSLNIYFGIFLCVSVSHEFVQPKLFMYFSCCVLHDPSIETSFVQLH